jgi:hypothetical protein
VPFAREHAVSHAPLRQRVAFVWTSVLEYIDSSALTPDTNEPLTIGPLEEARDTDGQSVERAEIPRRRHARRQGAWSHKHASFARRESRDSVAAPKRDACYGRNLFGH